MSNCWRRCSVNRDEGDRTADAGDPAGRMLVWAALRLRRMGSGAPLPAEERLPLPPFRAPDVRLGRRFDGEWGPTKAGNDCTCITTATSNDRHTTPHHVNVSAHATSPRGSQLSPTESKPRDSVADAGRRDDFLRLGRAVVADRTRSIGCSTWEAVRYGEVVTGRSDVTDATAANPRHCGTYTHIHIHTHKEERVVYTVAATRPTAVRTHRGTHELFYTPRRNDKSRRQAQGRQ